MEDQSQLLADVLLEDKIADIWPLPLRCTIESKIELQKWKYERNCLPRNRKKIGEIGCDKCC